VYFGSATIERFLAKKCGLMGRDLSEEAKIDGICELIREITKTGPLTVGALAASLGLTPGNASRHLNRLQTYGLLRAEKRANQVYYRLRDARLSQLLAALYAICDRRE
jgi:DNA-binding transcriptional ArsR family regulator